MPSVLCDGLPGHDRVDMRLLGFVGVLGGLWLWYVVTGLGGLLMLLTFVAMVIAFGSESLL